MNNRRYRKQTLFSQHCCRDRRLTIKSNSNSLTLQNSTYKKILLDVTFAITALTVIVYIIGWSYLFTLFNNFKIDVATIGFSFDYVLIQGYFSLIKYILFKINIIGCLFIVLILLVVLWQYAKSSIFCFKLLQIIYDYKFVISIVIFFLVIISGRFIINIGSEAARKEFIQQRKNNFEDYPRIKIWLNPDILELGIVKKLSLGCYRLFFHKDNIIYIFDPDDSNNKDSLNIIEIRTDGNNYEAMQIQNWTYPYNCK